MNNQLSVVVGDITNLTLDAIVNAANETLLGGGGVDGAIHRAAGPELLAACRLLNGCLTGEAKITPGFQLPSRFVIHTVGPIWRGGAHRESELLASCYHKSLQLAEEKGLASIAFPAISTGVYGYPKLPATDIAVRQVTAFLQRAHVVKSVVFCCFSENDGALYRQRLMRNSF